MRNVIIPTIIALVVIFVGIVLAFISPFLLAGILIGFVFGGIIGAAVAVNLNVDKLSEILGRVNINSVSARQSFTILGVSNKANFEETYASYREKREVLEVVDGYTELEISEVEDAKAKLKAAYDNLVEIRLWHRQAQKMQLQEEQEAEFKRKIKEMEQKQKEEQLKLLQEPSIEEQHKALEEQRIAQQELLKRLKADSEKAKNLGKTDQNSNAS